MDLPLKFKAVKKIFPLVKRAEKLIGDGAEANALDLTECTIEIISAALSRRYPECTPEFIEDELELPEVITLHRALPAILSGSGLSQGAEPGEAAEEEGRASPSTETSTS